MRPIDLRDPEQRRLAVETLRLAADALEKGQGEEFAVRVEAHREEAFVGRFVAVRETSARRVQVRVVFVAEPTGVGLLGAG